ncbi:hypothetical protein B4U79_02666, partial [Dinothrombium tinctorium]
KALEFGYKIKKIYEVYNYKEKSNQLFSQYMNMWAKLKQEASGWPDSSYENNEQKQDEYIKQYFEKEGIQLEKSKIKKNSSLRFIAKIMLNSFWGKLAQRPNLERNELINSYEEYIKLIIDPEVEITAEKILNENTMIINWKYANEDDCSPGNTSVVIAAFVTS